MPTKLDKEALGKPIQTNKFYGNLIVPNNTYPVYQMPYTLFWNKTDYGTLCISHTDQSELIFGPPGKPVTNFDSPADRCPIGFGAKELTHEQDMKVSNLGIESVDVTWMPKEGSGSMHTTLVPGSAFITMEYSNLQPVFFSTTNDFTEVVAVDWKPSPASAKDIKAFHKFRITTSLTDTWLVYVFNQAGTEFPITQTTNDETSLLVGPPGFSGIIQMARLPGKPKPAHKRKGHKHSGGKHGKTKPISTTLSLRPLAPLPVEAVYDKHVGTFPTTLLLAGSVTDNHGTYSFDYKPTQLLGNELLTLLYPHQQDSIKLDKTYSTDLTMSSISKGMMKGYGGNPLVFEETDLPIEYSFFAPLKVDGFSEDVKALIRATAADDLTQNITAQSNQEFFYFAAKAIAKFAQLCLVQKEVLGEDPSDCLEGVKAALGRIIDGTNATPLVYDSTWKGVISSCFLKQKTLDLQQSCDFGNPTYNDHHFHFGYVLYAASLVGHLDSSWLTEKNKAFMNMLARDYANPSSSDPNFPQLRAFSPMDAHAWAHGYVPVKYGKDEESTSEDYNSVYALKLWGQVIKDKDMEDRANLMLAMMKRSMQSYMLMTKDNKVQPKKFIPNFVSGILFESKVFHTTWFGDKIAYIHGIHVLPMTSLSSFFRSAEFVQQEWSAVFKNVWETFEGGWRGLAMANYGIIKPKVSFEYFADVKFNKAAYIDDGATLTWYLTLAAGRGGATGYSDKNRLKYLKDLPRPTSTPEPKPKPKPKPKNQIGGQTPPPN
ncbi:endo-1,3(4)-beta-glucanase [Protomyces lactucae-debilis]|uniref:glucan endo-1,3-beta-D-glucosidase n=1 Tax=Protomyces lactucae-debilis TaxID=2754530 RepID=A0A1Y2FH25_PROLT|nr:endo-1,3(4)-beta-glucanase [Protomyces lactucae-debilis]ORY82704.1 endo-1,3(4)-beta-glucanase [Protomyces lactucae-debilis]